MELYQANQWADQAQREKINLCGESEIRNRLFQESRARDCQEIEELRRICCEETDRARQLKIDELSMEQERNPTTVSQLLAQIQNFQNRVNSFSDAREFYDPETANSSGATHVSQPTLNNSESQNHALLQFWIAARHTEFFGYFRKRFWKPTCSRRTILSFLRKFTKCGIIFLRIGTSDCRNFLWNMEEE